MPGLTCELCELPGMHYEHGDGESRGMYCRRHWALVHAEHQAAELVVRLTAAEAEARDLSFFLTGLLAEARREAPE